MGSISITALSRGWKIAGNLKRGLITSSTLPSKRRKMEMRTTMSSLITRKLTGKKTTRRKINTANINPKTVKQMTCKATMGRKSQRSSSTRNST
jgi:hypothetical protein